MRLIATDVDGTIVAPGSAVSPRTGRAFASAHAAGILTAVVTGRPMRWMADVVAALGWVDALVLANGALIHRLPGGALDGREQLVERYVIPPDDVLDWAVRLRAAVPGVAFGLERPGGFGAEPGYETPAGTVPAVVAGLPELLDADPVVVKLLARIPVAAVVADRPGDRLLVTARRVLAGRVAPVHSDSSKPLIELGPPGVDKGTGLARVAQLLGVDRADVVAFGDMPNDVPMLAWAGRGYAMADGHPDAVAAAAGVVGPCGEDGVACAVEGLVGAVATA